MRLAVITDDCDHTHSVGIARVNLVEVRVILDNTLESSEAFFLDICVECVEVLKVRSYKSLASDTTFEVSQLAENLFFFVEICLNFILRSSFKIDEITTDVVLEFLVELVLIISKKCA